MFRWRHQARIERMEERKRQKEELEQKRREVVMKKQEIESKKQQQQTDSNLEKELQKLQLEQKELEKREQEIEKAERNAPWNVDTISKESWSKTVINKPKPREDRSKLTDEEIEQRYKDFVQKYEDKVKEYAMISKFDDAKQFLMQNPDLGKCHDHTTYAIWFQF